MSDDWTHDEDYTRIRFHVQRGDGPDNRADVTVEVSRNSDKWNADQVRREAEKQARSVVSFLEDEILNLDAEDDEQ